MSAADSRLGQTFAAAASVVTRVLHATNDGSSPSDSRGSPSADSSFAVEAQAEASHAHACGNVWSALRSANLPALQALLGAHPHLIDSRGAVGETLLHACYLYNTPPHKAIARVLLGMKPSLIRCVYEGPPYYGENVLHMAVANSDEAEVQFLTGKCRELLSGRASGTFFARHGGSAYMGEFPLSFAAVSNQAGLVRYLVEECGADLSARDSLGNTVAHMCVFHGRLDMYNLCLALWGKGYGRPAYMRFTPLTSITNGDGLTPLVLAASLGNQAAFMHVWDHGRELQWSWGAISAYMYPLSCVDDIGGVLAREATRKAVEGRKAQQRRRRLELQHPPRRRGVVEGGGDFSSAFSVVQQEESEEGGSSPVPGATTKYNTAASGRSADASTTDLSAAAAVAAANAAAHARRRRFAHLVKRAAILERKRRDAELCAALLRGGGPRHVAPVTVLQLVATTEACESILELPRMRQLVDKKWTRFAYEGFTGRLRRTLGFLLLYTTVLVIRSHTTARGRGRIPLPPAVVGVERGDGAGWDWMTASSGLFTRGEGGGRGVRHDDHDAATALEGGSSDDDELDRDSSCNACASWVWRLSGPPPCSGSEDSSGGSGSESMEHGLSTQSGGAESEGKERTGSGGECLSGGESCSANFSGDGGSSNSR